MSTVTANGKGIVSAFFKAPLQLIGVNFSQTFIKIKRIAQRTGQMRRFGKETDRMHEITKQRLQQDLRLMIPFTVFSLLPGSYFMLPSIMKRTPSLLPSTIKTVELENLRYQSLNDRIDKSKNIVLEASRKLATVVKEKNEFVGKRFQQTLRKAQPANSELFAIHRDIRNDFNFAKLSNRDARAFCRILSIPLTWYFPRTRLFTAFSRILQDDTLLRKEGISTISQPEISDALATRGYKIVGISVVEQKRMLTSHLHFSSKMNVLDGAMFVLSRALSK